MKQSPNQLRNLASDIMMELSCNEQIEDSPNADLFYNASDALIALARFLESQPTDNGND